MKNAGWGEELQILDREDYDLLNDNDFPILFHDAWVYACRTTGGNRLYGV